MSDSDIENKMEETKHDNNNNINKAEGKSDEPNDQISDVTSHDQAEISLDGTGTIENDKNCDDHVKNGLENSEYARNSTMAQINKILIMKENVDIKYGLLIGLIKVEQIEKKEIFDAALHLLVSGPFDMEQNFMIHSHQCVIRMLEVIKIVEPSLKAELLSVFIAILRKSKCNLKMTIGTNIIETTLEMLNDTDKLVKQFLIELLGIVAQFSITVKELRSILQKLKQDENRIWCPHSADFLKVLQQMPSRSGPDYFFNFPGTQGSALAIPPISKWPYQNGWTFNCWIHLDPASATNTERDTPYLYCFRTNKGLGYSANFVGNSLVITTMKMRDKGLQHYIKYNFQPRKWYMITVVYVYNRWSKSEIRCYVDGQLTSQVEMSWQVNTNESFDRCFIGASPEHQRETLLTGQISCIYGFTESLNPHQISAIYSLGPSYIGNFKFESEASQNISDSQRKSAFEGRLTQSLMLSYNPIACDRQLCLNQAPKVPHSSGTSGVTGSGGAGVSGGNMFAHFSHALMMGDVQPVLTQSIFSTLHSLGGIKILYTLFAQLDCRYYLEDGSLSEGPVPGICAQLVRLISRLILTSSAMRQQLVQSKGLLLVSQYINSSQHKHHLNEDLLDAIIDLCGTLSLMHSEHKMVKVQQQQQRRIIGGINSGSSAVSGYTLADQLAAVTKATGPKFQSASVGGGSNAINNSNTSISSGTGGVTVNSSSAESDNVTMATVANHRSTVGTSQSSIIGASYSLELIKHIYDYILSNTALWIYAQPDVQLRLYNYLSEELLSEGVLFNKTRCINAVLQYLYAMKYYYWVVDPRDRSGITSKRPCDAPSLSVDEISQIRTSILMFLKKLMLKCHNGILDEELQGLLNYLMVVNEDENISQILYFCVTLMAEQPSTMVPAFDRKMGIRVIFKLLGSPNETVRIMALKLLGYFLQRSTYKRKQDSMSPYNLYSLIGERLVLHANYLSIPVYNTLYEIMVEKMTLNISTTPHATPEKLHRLENPLLLKVIAHLIRQSSVTYESIQVHKLFLSDLTHLCQNSRDNRRTVLQMSVWQDWLFMLAPLQPATREQIEFLETVLALVRLLLHHAIKVEYGGWRVWIDTLAILHWKVEYSEFIRHADQIHRRRNSKIDQSESGILKSSNQSSLNSSISNSDITMLKSEYQHNVKLRIAEDELAGRSKPVDLAESIARNIINDMVDSAATETSATSKNGINEYDSRNAPEDFSPGPRSLPFRIPEFSWSSLHQRLLHDLLWTIEKDLQIWERINNKAILDFVNSSENQTYIINLVHLVTMLSDTLITCCGGLLPLLAAATSPTGDVDMLENGQGMKMSRAISFLLRIMNITDIVVFASSLNFADLEQEKTMTAGGILRQCLRLVCTCAVRNCLENRFRELHFHLFNEACQQEEGFVSPLMMCHQMYDQQDPRKDTGSGVRRFSSSIGVDSHLLPPDPLQELIRGLRPRNGDPHLDELQLQNYPIADPQVLLQEMDINRLRAVIYRDADEAKQAQFLALAIVYFLSVLMVSRYRDLLEPPSYELYSEDDDDDDEEEEEEEDEEDEDCEVEPEIENVSEEMCKEEEHTPIRSSTRNENIEEEEEEEEVEEEEEEVIETIDADENEEEEDINDDLYAREVSVESDGRRSRISGKVSQNSNSSDGTSGAVGVASLDRGNSTGISAIRISGENDKENQRDSTERCTSVSPHDFTESKLPDFPQSTKTHMTRKQFEQKDRGVAKSKGDDTIESDVQKTYENRKHSECGSECVQSVPISDFVTSSNLTKRLEQALGGAAPLIREIFFDFSTYLSRTLVGSHGQELISSGLLSLKQSTSVVEMVMLLCSQEWQNSLQKHAGLAFIELVNEGRLLAHASRDHIVRVANEAHFILSRMRAEDVQRHGEFGRQCALTRQERNEEEHLAEHMIVSARARDDELSQRLQTRIYQLVFGSHGIWDGPKSISVSSSIERRKEFYQLDFWEDDSRRRRRFVPNPYGSCHEEALLVMSTSNSNGIESSVACASDNRRLQDTMKQLNLVQQRHHGNNSDALAPLPLESEGHGVTDEELDLNKSVGSTSEGGQTRQSRTSAMDSSEIVGGVTTSCPVETTELLEPSEDLDSDQELSEADMTGTGISPETGEQNEIMARSINSGGGGVGKSGTVSGGVGSSLGNGANKTIFSNTTASGTEEGGRKSSILTGKSNVEVSSKPLALHIHGPVVMSTKAILLAPGVNVHGLMSITKSEFYFEMDADNADNIGLDKKVLCYLQHLHGKWHFSEIRAIFSRKFLHRNLALEIFVANRTAVMFSFSDQEIVRRVVYALPRVGVGVKYCVTQHRKSSLASPRQLFRLSSSTMTQRWQRREISNFDYLMYLNTVAGRTYNDLNQYPIFPWVLANYETEKIDLTSPANYRDLSSPIGALNTARKQFFDNRYKNWDDDSQPPFHYGTHYSTAAFVLNYLIRIEPFTSFFLNLQGGKFDHPDRIFHSILQTWKNCQRDTSDVKELIPEFFYLPEMFLNSNLYKFGKSDDGFIVDDVQLPPWASSPEEFVRINRMALESEFVSSQLHHWIDLIFGYKQRGPEAVRSTNVFCYLTYEGSVNWDEVKDPMLRQALEDQIRSFGQTPSQLLTEPHPPRNSALHVSPLMFTPVQSDLLMVLKFLSNSALVWLSANVQSHSPSPAVMSISAGYYYGIHRWNHLAADSCRKPVAAQTSVTSLASTLPLTTPHTTGTSGSAVASATGNVGSAASTAPGSSGSGGTGIMTYNPSLRSNSSVSNNTVTSTGSIETNPSDRSNFVPSSVQLPLSMDPLLGIPSQISKRSLGDGFDLSLRPHNHQFICTADNKVIFATGFWDKSFRAFSTDTGRVLQVVYGHFGVVTCVARSESGLGQDCYVVTGSTDCTVMLWLWGHRHQALLGDFNCREVAQPRMTITGHQAEVVCVEISGELGIIISASQESRYLVHSLHGELLHSLAVPEILNNPSDDTSTAMEYLHKPHRVLISREGYVLVLITPENTRKATSHLIVFTINGKFICSTATTSLGSCTTSMVISRNAEYVLLAADDGTVKVHRIYNLELVHEYPRCDSAIYSLALTTDQRFVIAGLSNGCIVIFNIDFYKWHHEFRDRYPAL